MLLNLKNTFDNQENSDFLKYGTPIELGKHDYLHESFRTPKDIYILCQGKLELGFHDSLGNRHTKCYYSEGEIIGYTSIKNRLDEDIYVRAVVGQTKLIKLTEANAQLLSEKNNDFARLIEKQKSLLIRKLNRRLEILFCPNVRIRLLKFIKSLADDFGEEHEGGINVKHHLTQSDIASNIGLSRKSTSLLLNQLEKEGIILNSKGKIFIPKLSRLDAI